ncbi:MAG: hypothetical protein WBV94_20835 [Blastocatellia bacterium]
MIRAGLTLVMAVLLVAANGSLAYSQRQNARRPQLNQRSGIYDRSYLQGYNEGFGQGQADWNRRVQRSDQPRPRDRSIEKDRDDLTQGYNLGLELGYSDGYYGRARNSTVPANASAMSNPASVGAAERPRDRQSVSDSWDRYSNSKSYPPLSVPDDTEMRLRLTSPVNTKINKVGDRFTAAITSPSRYVGARVEGHIASLTRSGQITGKTELRLAFDTIILADGEQGPLSADLERILISEQVKRVDEEGRIESGSRTVLRGTVGVGTVYVEGINDLILDNGTEMVIRTVRQKP